MCQGTSALGAISRIGGEKAIKIVHDYISNPKNKQIEYALMYLGDNKKEREIKTQSHVAKKRSDNHLKENTFLRKIKQSEGRDKIYCIDRLSEVNPKKAAEFLSELVSDQKNPDIDYALNISGVCGEYAVEFLGEYILNPENKHIDRAIWALGQTKSSKAVEYLIKYLYQKEKPHVGMALSSLDEIGGEAIAKPLVDYFKSLPFEEHSQSYALLQILNNTNTKEAAQVLVSLIPDPKVFFFKEDFNSLHKVVDKELIPSLNEIIKNSRNLEKINFCYDAIQKMHQKLKPQGCNPEIKN